MTQHALSVFDGRSRVGTVQYESLEERFSFEYDEAWRVTENTYSISPHMPINGSASSPGTVRRFLENLLPEGKALDVVASTYQVSKNNLYALIRQLGHETSGALSFLPVDATPEHQVTTRREITRDELQRRIDERAEIPFVVWDGRVRLSIAGHQDKLAVYQEDERMYLVEGELASTHILKPEPADNRLPMLVANEHFSMSLAARLGLSAAAVSILRVPDPVLVIERFDRMRIPDGVRRLHIIDSCQALNLPVSYKYERNFGSGRDVRDIREGVSFERLFSVTDYTVRKAVTRLALIRWALFQYLVGNADAHGKNVSFFCQPEGLALAPFYDLVSLTQYEALDQELAMAYGDEFRLDAIRSYDWAAFALRTSIPRPLLAREMRRIASNAVAAATEQANMAIYEGPEKELVARIAAFVQKQAAALVSMAAPMLKVKLE
ncbi:MAG: HipA domain-containing protein [Bryobacteraceae bacterium]